MAGKKQAQKQKAGFHENSKTGLHICNQDILRPKTMAWRQRCSLLINSTP
jgi:hypothetical protein